MNSTTTTKLLTVYTTYANNTLSTTHIKYMQVCYIAHTYIIYVAFKLLHDLRRSMKRNILVGEKNRFYDKIVTIHNIITLDFPPMRRK